MKKQKFKPINWIYVDTGDKTCYAVCVKEDDGKLKFCGWMGKSSVPKEAPILKHKKEEIGL